MCAVNVRISHDDYLAVASLAKVEVFANARAERRYHRAYLGVGEDFI